MELQMQAAELEAYLADIFPQIGDSFLVEDLKPYELRMRMPISHKHLRPGGTVSGPSMFALADVSVYAAVLAMIGREALAVTTNISMDFMRKPAADRDLVCDCKLLKLGRVLAVGECLIYSAGVDAPVARASMTYSIPPKA